MVSVEGQEQYVPIKRYEQLLDVLKHRRAVRGYKDKPVEEEKIQKILEAGRWAPSGANSQPWEFIVVEDEDLIWEIGDAYVQAYDEKFMDNVPKFPVDNKRWHREVPVYIVVLGDERARKAYPTASMEGEEMANLHTYLVSIGCAMYAMWLAATTLGLSTTMATCLSSHAEHIRKVLDIPEHYDVVATLPIGYPLKYQETRYRRPIDDFVHWGGFDPSKDLEDGEKKAQLDQMKRSRYRGDGNLTPSDSDGDDVNSK